MAIFSLRKKKKQKTNQAKELWALKKSERFRIKKLVERLESRANADRGRRTAKSRPIRADFFSRKPKPRLCSVFRLNLSSLKMSSSSKDRSFSSNRTLRIPFRLKIFRKKKQKKKREKSAQNRIRKTFDYRREKFLFTYWSCVLP